MDVSVLSLGCMRFPSEEQAQPIVAKAIACGINYFETSIGYSDSELWLGKALGADRKKILLSTKSAPGEDGCMTADEARRKIDSSLSRLKTDYLDFYHAWRTNNRKKYESLTAKGGWLEGVLKARDEGLIRHVGITSHSTPEHIHEIIKDGLFEVLTVQYSLILSSYKPVVAEAAKRGMGVVIMGPLAGGLLTNPSPVLKEALGGDDQIAGAFRYVLSDPAVSTIASGMTSAAQVEENCARIDAMPEKLSIDFQQQADRRIRAAMGDNLNQFETVLCGGCRYCGSICPKGLGPHNIFKAYNMAMLGAEVSFGQRQQERAKYILDNCTRCGKCETVCPQKINVSQHMETVFKFFQGKK